MLMTDRSEENIQKLVAGGHHYQGQQTSRWKLEAQQNFWRILYEKVSDADTENELKETFPVFSKYNEDRITAEELKLVLSADSSR